MSGITPHNGKNLFTLARTSDDFTSSAEKVVQALGALAT